MADIKIKDGLIYTSATLTHGNNKVIINGALIDTGSAATVISSDVAEKLGLSPEPEDMINLVQGVGGYETVIEKKINSVCLDTSVVADFEIQISGMDYGIKLEAIIGLDMLMKCKVLLDLDKLTMETV